MYQQYPIGSSNPRAGRGHSSFLSSVIAYQGTLHLTKASSSTTSPGTAVEPVAAASAVPNPFVTAVASAASACTKSLVCKVIGLNPLTDNAILRRLSTTSLPPPAGPAKHTTRTPRRAMVEANSWIFISWSPSDSATRSFIKVVE
eukprot:CAMPEP_0117891572 /NCGR_PEP_ID=MMETSP0950-20121206/24049_1 /TAXON_ID=44440 /ORGANISM="Chattonella subsalsa, Strain CCMP2191" /LENGTH=144 /DNA_ID=CAMNT_0005751143 /DNA_START=211 /DNA_END=646 /DNA_ORIENTATION=-